MGEAQIWACGSQGGSWKLGDSASEKWVSFILRSLRAPGRGRVGGPGVSGRAEPHGSLRTQEQGTPELHLHPSGPDKKGAATASPPHATHGATRLWQAHGGSELIMVPCQVLPVVGGLAAHKHVPITQDFGLAQTAILEGGSEVSGDRTGPLQVAGSLSPLSGSLSATLSLGLCPPPSGALSLSLYPLPVQAWPIPHTQPSVLPEHHLVGVALVQQVVGLHQRLVLGGGQHPVADLTAIQPPILVQIPEISELLSLCLYPGGLLLPSLL